MDHPSPLLIARLGLATVFVVAGAAKLRDPAGSRAAMAGFGVPGALSAPLAVMLPVLEILVALALIPSASARWGASGALALLSLFVAGIARVMIRGQEAECHCFGQLHSSRVGWPTLVRNLALALVAGVVLAGGRGLPTLSDQEWILVAIVGAGGWFLIHLLRQHGRILLRLDALEEQLASRASADGLAPGAPAPAFALTNLGGGSTSLDDLLTPGLPLMLVFGHPGCPPCVDMLPELAGWQRAHRGDLSIALVSQGSRDENRAATSEHGIERVLLQRERETAEAYQAHATPSAVLVSREGVIASPMVQGAAAIRVMLQTAASVPRKGSNVH